VCQVCKKYTRAGSEVLGFTLLELLIAIIILAIITSIVYGSFASVTGTMDIARSKAERLRFKQVVWKNLSDNLQGVYIDAAGLQPEYQFLGESGDGPFGPADTLRFATSLPMPGARALPGVTRVVSYALVDQNEAAREVSDLFIPDDDRPDSILLVKEQPLELESGDFMATSDSNAEGKNTQAIPIASMDIRYFDSVRKDWVDDWDSVEERRLPSGIHIKINFPRSEEERQEMSRSGIDLSENPDLEIMMTLPLGLDVEFPFPDFNNLRFTDNDIL